MKVAPTTFLIFLVGLILSPTLAFAQTPTDSTNIIGTLFLTRTGERVASTNKTGKVALAKRGILQAGNLSFHTIERIGTVSLHKGTYEIFMEQQHNPDTSEKRKVFRIKAEGSLGHNLKSSRKTPAAILIHVANTPHQLTGCIAPGLTKDPEGVGNSVAALNDIFNACGGFVDGKKVFLVVRN